MKLNLEINNTVKSPIKKKFLIDIAQETFNLLEYKFLKNTNIFLSIGIVSKNEIKKLNNKYRKYDKTTDVLSFAEYCLLDDIKKDALTKKEIFLGELILCYQDIEEYADINKLDLKKELAKVFSHGILHLLGFSHGKKMFLLQEKVSNYFVK